MLNQKEKRLENSYVCLGKHSSPGSSSKFPQKKVKLDADKDDSDSNDDNNDDKENEEKL